MSDRVQVEATNLTVCANGHIVHAERTGNMVWLYRHACCHMTDESAPYCQRCGGRTECPLPSEATP